MGHNIKSRISQLKEDVTGHRVTMISNMKEIYHNVECADLNVIKSRRR